MVEKLTEAQIAEYKDTFELFDKDGTGKIPSKELGTVIRALGHNPSEAELKEMLNKVSAEPKAYIQFSEFLSFMEQKKLEPDSPEDIIEGLRWFDKDEKGYILVSDLRHVLTNMGEKMTDEEMDELLGYADIKPDGLIDYQAFVNMIMK